MERIETVIVGGGQAGLATSYFLKQQGQEHVVLEKESHPAPVWRNERWDSFTLVTPNWTLMVPGAEYDGPEPEAFTLRDDVVGYFDRYVDRFQTPLECNVTVDSIEPLDGKGYRVQTSDRIIEAHSVVIATGSEQRPKVPLSASALSPEIMQLHSSRYRNPESLPPGAVLVVGSAQSGCQIAEELSQRGRQVYLSIGNTGRAPRRYRGKDIFQWLYLIGFFDLPPEKFPVPKEQFSPPHVSGSNGGHSLNLHQFARDGVTLLGHFWNAAESAVSLEPDLHECLTRSDGFEVKAREMVDGYIQARGLDAPAEELTKLRDGYEQPVIEEIDLKAAGISTVIWATGYTYDHSFVKVPVFDEKGFPKQTRGVTDSPGLYFVGMMWMPSIKTGILAGVGESAEHIATSIVERSRQPVNS